MPRVREGTNAHHPVVTRQRSRGRAPIEGSAGGDRFRNERLRIARIDPELLTPP